MATIRVIPLDDKDALTSEPCIACGRQGQVRAYFARSY
jgi:hypothetical protein